MAFRVAINGYGRIGQCVLRALFENPQYQDLELVAINELSDIDTIAYLTRYDTTHGRFPFKVDVRGSSLKINDQHVEVLRFEDSNELPWKELGIDLVMECTGLYGSRDLGQAHLDSGASRVLYSQPGASDLDQTVVFGVNHDSLKASDQLVSNASCTTNAIVPVIKCLQDAFGIEHGTMTTIHSAMNDQPTIDAYHHHDLRRTRSAMHNMVPVDTELAKGVARLLPEMSGKLEAIAMRVPTINVSAIDLTINVGKDVSQTSVNQVIKKAAAESYSNILSYTEEPLASCDFNHDTHSAIVDGSQTRVSGQRLVKVLTWFDNEWAFANRMCDVASHWLQQEE